MAKTVYVLGAGVNMVVRHRMRELRPPLARDFFRQLHRGLSTDGIYQHLLRREHAAQSPRLQHGPYRAFVLRCYSRSRGSDFYLDFCFRRSTPGEG